MCKFQSLIFRLLKCISVYSFTWTLVRERYQAVVDTIRKELLEQAEEVGLKAGSLSLSSIAEGIATLACCFSTELVGDRHRFCVPTWPCSWVPSCIAVCKGATLTSGWGFPCWVRTWGKSTKKQQYVNHLSTGRLWTPYTTFPTSKGVDMLIGFLVLWTCLRTILDVQPHPLTWFPF